MWPKLAGQFGKFAVVGISNTLVDFVILNILSYLTHTYSGSYLIILNSISFAAAVANSYFLNKYWTFKGEGESGVKTREASSFIVVSLIGLAINSGIVYFVTTYASAPFSFLTPALWENFAKVMATGIALIWNFIGYKFIVFKKTPQ